MFVSYNPAERKAGGGYVLEAGGGVEEGVPPVPPKQQPKPLKATVPTATVPTAPNTVFMVQGAESFLNGEYAADPAPAGPKPTPDDGWPYATVIDAIRDGWRVISFPNMALSLDENRTYGLGFEFILERWR